VVLSHFQWPWISKFVISAVDAHRRLERIESYDAWMLTFSPFGILLRRRNGRRRFGSIVSYSIPGLMSGIFGTLCRRADDRHRNTNRQWLDGSLHNDAFSVSRAIQRRMKRW
jgi:hypothetical protein